MQPTPPVRPGGMRLRRRRRGRFCDFSSGHGRCGTRENGMGATVSHAMVVSHCGSTVGPPCRNCRVQRTIEADSKDARASMQGGKVFIPAFTAHPDVDRAFMDSGFELDFALSPAERAHGRWAYERAEMRSAVMEAALAD